jgi:hypothetical protein
MPNKISSSPQDKNNPKHLQLDEKQVSRAFEIALILIIMGIYLYAALSEGHNFAGQWFIRDDAFYYFKVAQNITEGHGVTFDGINPTNGYHPLWMLVCIPVFALARFDLILPLRVLVVISGMISLTTGILLFRLVKRTISLHAAMLAGSYWVFDRTIHYTVTMFGLETGLTALMMCALLLAMADLKTNQPLPRRKILTISLLAVGMVYSRLDTIFLALLAGAWILLRGTPIRTRLMLDVGIIVSAAFLSVVSRTGLPAYFSYSRSAVIFAVIGLMVQIPIYYFSGMYSNKDEVRWKQIARLAWTTALGTGLTSLLMVGLLAAGHLPGLPRSALLLYAVIVFFAVRVVRIAARTNPAETKLNWHQVIHEGTSYYGILGGALAIYMTYNKIAFGTFMPVSGQIKAWWGSLQGSAYGNPITNLAGLLGLEREEGLNAWGPIIYLVHDLKDWLGTNLWLVISLMLIVVLLILFTRPKRAAGGAVSMGLPVLLTGSLVQLCYYNGQGYAGAKDWYWVSQMIFFPLLGALCFDLILRPVRRYQWGQILAWGITATLCIGYYALPFGYVIVNRMPWGPERVDQPYMDVVPFLESNTEEGALIGMTGGGNVGYFIQGRTIINMDGLINSYAYFQALRAGQGDKYLASIGMDYIFANPDILLNPPYYGQFGEWSEKVAEFGKKDLMKYDQ